MRKLLLAASLAATMSGAAVAADRNGAALTEHQNVHPCGDATPGDRYNHASDACWAAFDAFMAKAAYAQALGAINTGCRKFARADQCLLAQRVKAAGTASGEKLAAALKRESATIGAWDIDDGETGVLVRRSTGSSSARDAMAAPLNAAPQAPRAASHKRTSFAAAPARQGDSDLARVGRERRTVPTRSAHEARVGAMRLMLQSQGEEREPLVGSAEQLAGQAAPSAAD